MELLNQKIILRDFMEADIEDMIHWETVETEWQLWDAPWEYNENMLKFNPEAYREKALGSLKKLNNKDSMRRGFQICVNDEGKKHIGWCNSYEISDNFEYTHQGGHCTIGIAIPDLDARHKGYATAAWDLFLYYLLDNGIKEIYTQTWSGNVRVIGLIHKVGFEECNRIINCRNVRGQNFDALTFKLNLVKFRALHEALRLS